MEQAQIKVSFSIGTKLLVSILFLVLISISLMDISSIWVLREDKRAYTIQSQSTEAVLVGKQFVNLTQNTINTLRLSLASIDPSKPINRTQKNALQSVLDNQSKVIRVNLLKVKPQTKSVFQVASVTNENKLTTSKFNSENLSLSNEDFTSGFDSLLHEGYSFYNLSQAGLPPLLVIALADLGTVNDPMGAFVAVAFISQDEIGLENLESHITVTDKNGWVLYDTKPEILYSPTNISSHSLFKTASQSKFSTGAQEYEHESQSYLGSYTLPGFGIITLSRTTWRSAMKATYLLIEKLILLAFIALSAAIIFAMFFAKSISAPISELYEATKQVAAGNFDLKLKPKSKDEIGALSSSFNVMSKKIGELIVESMEKVRLEGELAIASTVQQTLIPPETLQKESILIHSHYQSAEECGGDWWGTFSVDKKVCILIADATGHGLPSALITAAARSCFSVMHKLATEDPNFELSPRNLLSFANKAIHEASQGKIMMTFFALIIDLNKMELTYSSAGHNPPWLFKKSGSGYKMSSLIAKGQRLGEDPEYSGFEEKSTTVSETDILFLYTDGLLEGQNLKGDQYGKKRSRLLINKELKNGPKITLEKLVADFQEYNKGKPYDDDVTLAFVEMNSKSPGIL